MTKKQKLILIVLAIMDVLVIGGMAFVVWSSSRPVTPVHIALSPCEIAIQQVMQPEYNSSFNVSENTPNSLTVFLTTQYTLAESNNEQSLWQILDALEAVVLQHCTDTETITVHLSANDTQAYTFIVSMDDLNAWGQQDIDDTALAARIRYRGITRNEN